MFSILIKKVILNGKNRIFLLKGIESKRLVKI